MDFKRPASTGCIPGVGVGFCGIHDCLYSHSLILTGFRCILLCKHKSFYNSWPGALSLSVFTTAEATATISGL